MAISRSTPADHRKPRKGGHKRVWKDRHWKWVADGKGGWRKKGYIFVHHHKPKPHHKRGPGPKPKHPSPVKPKPPSTAVPPGAYTGTFGAEQATRLLNRAGFGPKPGQAAQLASLGLVAAVRTLTRPSGGGSLVGPAPVDDDGLPLAPADAWGHDHLEW